jgi:hypothetical protein
MGVKVWVALLGVGAYLAFAVVTMTASGFGEEDMRTNPPRVALPAGPLALP